MKKICKIIAVVAIVAAAGFTVYDAQANKMQLSNLAMDNIEAIARGEGGNCDFGTVSKDQYSHTLHCSGSGSLCCEW